MRDYLRNICVAFVCSYGLFMTGCTSSSSSPDLAAGISTSSSKEAGDLRVVEVLPPPANTNNGTDVLISENDLLEVDVFQVDELDKEVRVDPSGKISLALIGPVNAAGKTIQQLEKEIERQYGVKYLQNPEVSVFMKESAGQRITMDGAFVKPGIYASSSNTTLLQAVALAGGLTRLADEKKLFVYRQVGELKYVANYSVADIRSGKKSDPRIYGSDVVISFDSSAKIAAENLRQALGIATSATRLAAPI